MACATNPTPGTSAVTLPTTAADYVVYPSTNTNFATSDCCSTVANAATYNAFPTCGAATCNAGYSVSGASCVATSGGGSSSVGGNVGITTLGLPTPTPSPSPSPSVSATPTPTPSPAASAAVKLIRYANDPKVYVVENGQKRWVQTTEDFAKLGYKWSDVKITSASETYPDGTIMKVPSVSAAVTLIRYAGDPRVYVIENSQKRWVKTAEDFNKLGYKWGDVKIASASETYATGSDKTAPAVSGVLLTQALKKGSTGAQVKILQQKLKDLGYFPDKVATTTYFGNTTLQALKNFQKDKGLSPNGTLDVQTKALLNQ